MSNKTIEKGTEQAPAANLATRRPSALVTPTNAAALKEVTHAQRELGNKLAAIDEFLELPRVSAKKIAEHTWLFTLVSHGDTIFDKRNERGELVYMRDADGEFVIDQETGELVTAKEPVHLWLCVAQEPMRYTQEDGSDVNIAAGERFQISQKKGRLRDKIVQEIEKTLDKYGEPIMNVTCRFAKKSANAPATHSRPVTFAVAAFE